MTLQKLIETGDINIGRDIWYHNVPGLLAISSKRIEMVTGIQSTDQLIAFAKECSDFDLANLNIAKLSKLALARYVATQRKSVEFYYSVRGMVEVVRKTVNKTYGTDHGFVYWMKTERAGINKIGFSNCPERRLGDIKILVPDIKIIMYRQGNGENEKQMHDLLSDHCVGGEWFDARQDDILAAFDIVMPIKLNTEK